MGKAPVLKPEHRWQCPACDATHVTHRVEPHTPMHPCKAMAGLTVPYLAAGQAGEHQRLDREDYAGSDIIARDGDGQAVMAVVTVHDSGTHCTVYAPAAGGRGQTN